jgi:hypothetical protein
MPTMTERRGRVRNPTLQHTRINNYIFSWDSVWLRTTAVGLAKTESMIGLLISSILINTDTDYFDALSTDTLSTDTMSADDSRTTPPSGDAVAKTGEGN